MGDALVNNQAVEAGILMRERLDQELEDLLAEVETVQQAAFSKIKAGNKAGDMIAHAQSVLATMPNAAHTDFFGHGMGLISHESPFIMTNHPVRYDGVDASVCDG